MNVAKNNSKVVVEGLFDDSKYHDLLDMYFKIPVQLRPNRWSQSEKGKATPINDPIAFRDKILGSRSVPYMRGARGVEHTMMRGRIAVNGSPYFLKLVSWLTVTPEDTEDFFTYVVACKPFLLSPAIGRN